MNEYGRFAKTTWSRLAPTATGEMSDPDEFFRQLGERAADQVVDLMMELAGKDQPNETYFQKIGRVNNAKMRAQEIVRAELLTPPAEIQEDEETPDRPDLDSLLAMYREDQAGIDDAEE